MSPQIMKQTSICIYVKYDTLYYTNEQGCFPLCQKRFQKFRLEFKWKGLGAFHYAKDSGNFGRNSNGKVRFGFFRPEYSGSPLEVVHLFRLEYSDRNSAFHF